MYSGRVLVGPARNAGPRHQLVAVAASTRLYYEVEGSGEPVILIHAGVANLRMWDGDVAALRDAYRVIRYDTRGLRRTETDAVELSDRADSAALFDNLGEESAHVVGF